MNHPRSAPVIGIALLAFGAAILSAAGSEKTAGEVMKNVTVLKDVPISGWDDTMSFMSAALGVTCLHCHQGAGNFESDQQPAKQTARKMIQMTREINQKNFGGRIQVTCNTCHQGSVRPKAMPALWDKAAAEHNPAATPAPPPPPDAQPLPDAAQLVAAYRKAVAGDGVKSIRLTGTMTIESRPTNPIEIDIAFPDKIRQRVTVAGTEVEQVFNGDRGWVAAPGRKMELTAANAVSARRMIDAFHPLKFVAADTPRKTTGIEKIGDRTYAVVESSSDTRLERLYFDTQSGLLFKCYAESRTVLGTSPTELTFDNYRDVNGVKVPFLMTLGSTRDRAQYKFSEVQPNAALDPALFEPK